MQETGNNCFGSKIRSTALRQAKTGKHECRNVTATYMYISALVLTCFHLTKGHATYFRSKTIVASLLHLIVLLFKVLFNHALKLLFFEFLQKHLQAQFNFFFFFERKEKKERKE